MASLFCLNFYFYTKTIQNTKNWVERVNSKGTFHLNDQETRVQLTNNTKRLLIIDSQPIILIG